MTSWSKLFGSTALPLLTSVFALACGDASGVMSAVGNNLPNGAAGQKTSQSGNGSTATGGSANQGQWNSGTGGSQATNSGNQGTGNQGTGNQGTSTATGGSRNTGSGTSTGTSTSGTAGRANTGTSGGQTTGTNTGTSTGNSGTSTGGTSTGGTSTGGTSTGGTSTGGTSTGGTSTGGTSTGGTSTGGTSTGGTSTGGTSTGGTACSTTAAARVDNPYAGAKGYVNPEWKAKADAESGGSRISNNPTGVWMDRIAAIDGTGSSSAMGLRAHLEEAVKQGVGYIQIVIYDLPGRDCAALASNGELGPTDIDRYQKEYIDPIAAIEGDCAFSSLRIINVIEIDSLPNLVTNTGSKATATSNCDVMKANGNYQKGIAYALGKFHKLGNTYNYIDAGHHGWIGWEENLTGSCQLFAETAKAADGGFATVQGFIANTANYSALQEPYLKITEQNKVSKWIDYNTYVDELSFAKAMRTKLVSMGFESGIGMLIDTSRNGWGGPNRPTKASTATDIEQQVDESRIDKRFQAGNWCNQSGAGLGERPKSVGSDGIDAYVWIKPPGESDGASSEIANDQGKGFDRMCDPTYGGNARNGNSKSGALANSPLAGAWFSAQFQELMKNAYPALE